jgi:hypothetical protein
MQAPPEQCQYHLVHPIEVASRHRVRLECSRTQGASERSVEIRFDDGRVQVALAADRGGVSQQARDGFDGLDDIALRLSVRLKRRQLQKRAGDENGPSPRPEVLRREILTACLTEILIDVRRTDVVNVSVFVWVLEQLVTWKLLTSGVRAP